MPVEPHISKSIGASAEQSTPNRSGPSQQEGLVAGTQRAAGNPYRSYSTESFCLLHAAMRSAAAIVSYSSDRMPQTTGTESPYHGL